MTVYVDKYYYSCISIELLVAVFLSYKCLIFNIDRFDCVGGPWSPFQNNWELKSEFKSIHKRKELAQQYAIQF